MKDYRDENHCYICKMGWMDGERTPILYDRKGLWLCKGCKKLMDSREDKIYHVSYLSKTQS